MPTVRGYIWTQTIARIIAGYRAGGDYRRKKVEIMKKI